MKTAPVPPRWATAILSTFLPARAFESVSGDLLEEYRDSIYPSRGPWRADLWYASQVMTFLPRITVVCGILFAGQFLARTAIDAFLPTTDFHMRADVTTALSVGLLLVSSLWAAWRSNSVVAGMAAAVFTASLAAILSVAGAAMLLAFWHEPARMAAIQASGGLKEIFTLPLLVLVPAALLGAFGGGISVGLRRIFT